ncbi:MAG: hypothetical protein IIV62_01255, partial [Anaerotignum sp.]|nr:hypothetical protein [Anaerotignum sp.]
GEWITLLCDSLNKMPKDSEERKEALAFTLGVMLHYCGDLFGHDFINEFSGGAYPSLADVKYLDSKDPKLNYVLSHLAEEAYMDSLVNWGFYNNADYLNAKAPIQFVADSMIFDGSANGGAAKIFDEYGSVPPHFKYLIELRTTIYNKANEWRVNVNPIYSGAVMYLDAWIEDLDRATYALVGTFDNIANRLVTEADGSTIGIVKEELTGWLDKYGMYITPAPDALLTVMKAPGEITSAILQAIGAQTLLDAFNKWKNDLITDAVLWAIGIDEAVLNQHKARLEDPKVQLDHKDNPFKPSSNNFAEFKEYMDRFAMEQALLNGLDKQDLINETDNGALDKLIDSDLEAFYNTMTMFKMVLIGSKNFTDFITFLSGETQTAYEKNTGELAATSLKLQIATTDAQDAGTDDNIFAVVYKNGSSTPLIKKLLDISGYNDFEAGDNDEYFIELPEAVHIDDIEVHITQEGTGLAGPDWDCANINVVPMHVGKELIAPVGVGGNAKMNSGKTWDLRLQDAMAARSILNKKTQEVMNLKLWIHTADISGAGTDGDVYLTAYNSAYSATEPWVKV